MLCRSRPEGWLRILLLAGIVLSAPAAWSAPRTIQPFVAETWQELSLSARRPMVVVFSTTDCAHCPAVIDSLAASIHASHSAARLVVVVMDGADQRQALRADPHYRKANVLYAFDGDATALRFRINPDWRGVTPYVALMPADGTTHFHTGAPPAEALQALLRQPARR
ncbi:MAG: hypothetical protein NTX56_02240 [Proteobacteria bacterium]|nr:hypothetical protein [Pseudomonadota bacterium]